VLLVELKLVGAAVLTVLLIEAGAFTKSVLFDKVEEPVL
jgi:hypothetical protein